MSLRPMSSLKRYERKKDEEKGVDLIWKGHESCLYYCIVIPVISAKVACTGVVISGKMLGLLMLMQPELEQMMSMATRNLL
ncbi:hypothetical protein BHE74_00057171 [Ensete ventricosum]|nr:hypothetical protein BHE74_00057171 [Ensete ventricosum]